MHIENKTAAMTLVILLLLASGMLASAAYVFFAAQGQTAMPSTPSTSPTVTPSPTATPSPTLNATYIGQSLNTSIVMTNNQTGITTAVLIRQAPPIREGNVTVNNFTLMSSVVEFMIPPGATSNQTVYARGFFGLLENETNAILRQAVADNMTILNLHPFALNDTPKLQFLHWQITGNLSTILANIKNIVGNTTIGGTPAVTPQTQLNATYIGSKLGGTVINGAVVDVAFSRMDGNITAPGSFTGTGSGNLTLNGFATMGTLFEFMAANSSVVNASSGTVMVMGDFALKSNEVQGVEKVLMNSTAYPLVNVTVTAVHDHMLMETPKMTFLHFEAVGDLNQTINMLNAALSQTATRGT